MLILQHAGFSKCSQTRSGGTRSEVGDKFVAVLHGQQARVSRLHIDRCKPHQEGGEVRARFEGCRNGGRGEMHGSTRRTPTKLTRHDRRRLFQRPCPHTVNLAAWSPLKCATDPRVLSIFASRVRRHQDHQLALAEKNKDGDVTVGVVNFRSVTRLFQTVENSRKQFHLAALW